MMQTNSSYDDNFIDTYCKPSHNIEINNEGYTLLHVPLEDLPKKILDGLDEDSIFTSFITDNTYNKHGKPLNGLLSRNENDGGLEQIPSYYLEYSIEITDKELIVKALFENICRIALLEFYNTSDTS